jgi:heterodisulfide reductase subunit A-like polyferredoxin
MITRGSVKYAGGGAVDEDGADLLPPYADVESTGTNGAITGSAAAASAAAVAAAAAASVVAAVASVAAASGAAAAEPLVANCGTCRFCLDKTKFGGANRLRRACELRQAQKRQQEA